MLKLNKSNSRYFYSTMLSSLTIMLLTAVNVNAANIKVHVLDANKKTPIKDMAVCLGTGANPKQFGAVRTDSNGDVEFPNMPRTPLILTVSGAKHKGVQRIIPPQKHDFVRIIHLSLGGLGPACDAKPVYIESHPEKTVAKSIRIARVNLVQGKNNTKNRNVTISSIIKGKPTHYRVSENPDFKNAQWVDYKQTPSFTLSQGYGRKKVYFQVKKSKSLNDGNYVETASNVASDWITLN